MFRLEHAMYRANEKAYIEAVGEFIVVTRGLEKARRALKHELSDASLQTLADLVAAAYRCKWFFKSSNISFCDSTDQPLLTVRNDAEKFWVRYVLGKLK